MDLRDQPPAAGANHGTILLLGVLICAAAVALNVYPLTHPLFWGDDFLILASSLTWTDTWNNLWQPANEHAMPLGRLSSWALIQIAGRPTALPQATALQGPFALILGMWLLFLFVRREVDDPFPALMAMAWFGVTSVYQQAVIWFSSSFTVLAMDTLLLALLAAQRWRQTGRKRFLALSAFWAALAPAWFAIGILAGPICFLYLVPPRLRGDKDISSPFLRRLAAALVPSLGSAAFLAVSLPQTAHQIMHLEHYEGKTAAEAFHPLIGLAYTGRSLVDNLVLGVLGISGVTCPLPVVIVGLTVLASLAVWWWRRAPKRRLLLLGLELILSSYWLVYSARAEWVYEPHMTQPTWGRYHLLPQLGLALFLVGGPWLLTPGTRWAGDGSGRLTSWQIKAILLLIVLLFVTQFPRAYFANDWDNRSQRRVLQLVEQVDARCRAHRIAAATARKALQPLPMPSCGSQNSWDLLRGSPEPLPHSVEATRRLLDEEGERQE